MNRSVTVASALILSLPGALAVALADESSVPATAPIANEAITELEEIVVTASKRSEDVREVPTSISVLTGQQLQESHVVDFADLSQAVPGLSFSSQAGPGLSTLELRGISSAAGSATVGLYLDEVPVTIRNLLTVGNTEPSFFDIDRIEVLRGPQGTLYGDSSEGGTIRFLSVQPDTHVFSTTVHSEISNTEHGGINSTSSLVVNLPLSENEAALRVGVQHISTSGYIDQVSPVTGSVINSGIDSDTTDVVRATLLITPTDALTIAPALFFQRTRSADIDAYYLNPYTNPATGAMLTLGELQTAKLVREPGTDTLAVPSVTVKYDGTVADLTSVSSYFYRGFDRTQDGTVGDSVYLGSVLTANGFNGNSIAALPG
jgi:iron complex outermembrane receptor protein